MKSLFSSKAISAGLPGSTLRLLQIDETSTDWSSRANRKSGPDTYVHGDLCRSVFSESSRMNVRQRNDIYGGSVLLVGVVEARSIYGGSKGSSDSFVTVQLLDEEGEELKETSKDKNLVGKILSLGHDSTPAQRTRTLKDSLHPEWDEVFAMGAGIHDISEASTLRLKLSDFSSRKDKTSGVVDIPLNEILPRANTAHSKSFLDLWFDFTLSEDMEDAETEGLSSIHLHILYHAPPPDPKPSSIAVRLVHAVDLISADSNGFSDPYVKVKPLMRSGKHVKTTGKKSAELSTSVKKVTLNPVWNEILVFNDSSLGHPNTLQHHWKSPWGWPGAAPADLVSCPVHQLSTNDLGKTYSLALVLKDQDWGKTDDDLGEVSVRLSSIWGDEDAVLYGNTLRLDRWMKVRPHKSMPAELDGKLGMLHVDIVMRFEESLLPRPWVEAVDSESGESYWYNAKTRRGYWKMPNAVALGLSSTSQSSSTDAKEVEEDEGFRCTYSKEPHKPPHPAVKPDGTPIPNVDLIPEIDPTDADNINYFDEDDEEDDNNNNEQDEDEEEKEGEHEEEKEKLVIVAPSPKIVTKPAAVAAAPSPPQAPPIAPSLTPAPAPSSSSSSSSSPSKLLAAAVLSQQPKKSASNAKDDDDDDVDEPEFDAEAVAKATASIEIGKVKEAKVIESELNVLAHMGHVEGNRERLFFEQMKKKAAEKKQEEEERKRSKFASMTEEELAEAEKEKINDARRQQRMSRMTGQLAKGYGNSSVRMKMAAGKLSKRNTATNKSPTKTGGEDDDEQ